MSKDEEQPKSIEETLSEAYDELTTEEVEETEVEDESDTEDEATEETENVVDGETETPEGEDGEAEEASADDSGFETGNTEDHKSGEKSSEKQAEPEQTILPPTGWTAESKSRWADVPQWLKEQIHNREQDSIKGVMNLKEKADFGDRLSNTIQPYQPLLNSMGVTPETAVQDALNLAHSLSVGSPEQKAQLIRNIANQYQVDLSTVTAEQSDLEKATAPLQQQIQHLQSQIQNQQNNDQQQQLTAAKIEVQNFSSL